MIDLLFTLLSWGALWGFVSVLAAAILLNAGEKRHRREAQQDIGERARTRAEAHEAMAQSRLYPHFSRLEDD